MKIILASPRGFCAGVNMAIESLELAIERFGTPIYVYHEIGGPITSSVRSTTSMAMLTPAQNPRGLARMIFIVLLTVACPLTRTQLSTPHDVA